MNFSVQSRSTLAIFSWFIIQEIFSLVALRQMFFPSLDQSKSGSLDNKENEVLCTLRGFLHWKVKKRDWGDVWMEIMVILQNDGKILDQKFHILGHAHHTWCISPLRSHPQKQRGDDDENILASFKGTRYHLDIPFILASIRLELRMPLY